MVGQSQSGCRQLNQRQFCALVKKPFAPDKVLAKYLAAFDCSSSKSRKGKGVKDTERTLKGQEATESEQAA